jgi:iron complex outermembrane receptor protein
MNRFQMFPMRVAGKNTLLLHAAAAALAFAGAAPAFAQSPAETASSGTQLETVVVTATKRATDQLKVPGNITAVTSTVLQQRGVESVSDLAMQTPGISYDNAGAGSARADRSQATVIMRGMAGNANDAASLFINGVPVPNSAMLEELDDPDHVEVLKGPQSAYFGRATFSGAINVVTKQPANHWEGSFNAEAATRNTYVVSGNVGGPIIPDKLMATIGFKYDAHDGSYKNAEFPDQTLGDQKTTGFHVGLTAKPIDNLTVKIFGLYMQERDGPAATGQELANAGAFSQGNCTVAGSPYFCGTLPALNYAISPAAYTAVNAQLAANLAKPGILKGIGPTGYGLAANTWHADFTVDYAEPHTGLTFTNLFGMNDYRMGQMEDLSTLDSGPNGPYPGYSGVPGYTGYPYATQTIARNISEEFRVATDATKRLRALVGISYVINRGQTDGGAAAVWSVPTPSENDTRGIFFSVAYDILPQLTVNFDGRYQIDHETSLGTTGQVLFEGNNYNFLPRASIQYKYAPNQMVYFTYSEGASPSQFNSVFATLPASSLAELRAAGFSTAVPTVPELLTNYEIGIKGRFLDGRATVSADIYYDQWTKQLDATSYYYAAADPANPLYVPGNPAYNPLLSPTAANGTVHVISFSANNASTTPKGIEFDGQLIPVDHVTLNLAADINDTKYTAYICTACQPYTTFDAKGKQLPFAPYFSANVGAMYSNKFKLGARSMDWFARIDYIHRDGVYFEASNTAKLPNTDMVNVRGGVKLGNGFSLEGFVNNLTNQKSPTMAFYEVNFGAKSSPTGVDLALPQLITGGVVLRYKY